MVVVEVDVDVLVDVDVVVLLVVVLLVVVLLVVDAIEVVVVVVEAIVVVVDDALVDVDTKVLVPVGDSVVPEVELLGASHPTATKTRVMIGSVTSLVDRAATRDRDATPAVCQRTGRPGASLILSRSAP
jgi:hypothetical protein